jgi:nicotinamide-nucleotide amidase
VNVEIINTGTELLLGDIVNTSFQLLSRTLNDAGFNVLYQTTIGDNGDRLLEVLDIALHRADIVITTGGLGPTRGDITKEMVARYLKRPLVLSDAWVKKMEAFFRSRGLTMAANNKKQAMVPEGAEVFNNDVGTAPGLAIWTPEGKLIILLPGPPAETRFVLEEEVMPYLRRTFAEQGVIHSRLLHLRGISESMTAAKLDQVVMSQTNPTVAIYARKGEILIRITAKASSLDACNDLIAREEALIRSCVGEYIYGVDYETLAEALGKRLLEKHLTIAFAESCTGGLTSSLMTDVPGSSEYLLGSVVSYSNMAKHEILGVPQETLDRYTAVSRETAKAMAEGVRRLLHTDVGVSITGIAGPGGGTPEKPVGLVYEACATAKGTIIQELRYKASRTTIKMRAAMNAMSMAMDEIKKLD